MSVNPNAKQEIFIEEAIHAIRVAVLEDGILQELHIEHADSRQLVGNIYKAKVERVLPGMQAAFVNIGEAKNGFLGIKDLPSSRLIKNKNSPNRPLIETLIHQGESLWVQVSKDPYADKGARLTSELSIPAQLLVYLPNGAGIGVSHHIESDIERTRLRELVQDLIDEYCLQGGFIVRTQANQANADQLRGDVIFLQQLGKSLSDKMQNATGVTCVYQELSLTQRTLRDYHQACGVPIIFAEKSSAVDASKFVEQTMPYTKINIEYHSEPSLLFDRYDVEQQIDAALQEYVFMSGGGSLIIQQTVAMTTIDVNTKTSLSTVDQLNSAPDLKNNTTIEFSTNIEACRVIAQQVRLRNLGGIIIVDFIDMQKQQHKNQLISVLEEAFNRDPAKVVVAKVSMLGLVEISRQRTRQSLAMLLSEQCSTCCGRGWVKDTRSLCFEIFREIQRTAQQFEANAYTIVASTEIVNLLQGHYQDSITHLREKLDCAIYLKPDTSFSKQQYDIALNSI